MPIVTVTENEKTTYVAVTEGAECRVDAVVTEYKLSESNTREYTEYALRSEYLKRLTAHAHDCLQLEHYVANPPDEEDYSAQVNMTKLLADKVAKSAVWLRTYEPFVALTADVVGVTKEDGSDGYGARLQLGDKSVVAYELTECWEASRWALWDTDPWRRDHFARMEKEKAERDAARERKHTPAERKRIAKAAKILFGMVRKTGKAKRTTKRTKKAGAK